MRDLVAAHPRGEKKIERDAASYNNEAIFYRDFAAGLGHAGAVVGSDGGSVRLPDVFYSHVVHGQATPITGEYLSVVESLDGYEHHNAQNEDEIMASLAQIARWHAYFQATPGVMEDAKGKLWSSGGFWDPAKRRAQAPACKRARP